MSSRIELKTDATNEAIVKVAVELSKGFGTKRGSMPRFTLIADDEVHLIKSKTKLRNLLSTVRQGELCSLYRNFGFGATIEFK